MTPAQPGSDIDTESLKKEIKQELLKREILMGMDEDEIDLFELGKVLLRRWKLVFVMPVVVGLLAVAYSLTLPNFFKAQATVFVHSKGGGAMSSLLSALPMAGMLGGIGGGGSAEYLMTHLKSRTLTNEIIAQFGVATNTILLGDPLPTDLKYDDIVKAMEGILSVAKDKDGLITVAVETKAASLSAEMAEAYLKALSRAAKGPAQHKRVFIENQLAKTSKELEDAEMKFKAFQDKNKLVSVDDQARAIIENLVKLEASKTESEISVKMAQSMLKSLGNLPELVKIEGQKVSEEAKQQALQKAIADVELKLSGLPELALDFARLMRDLKVKEKLFGVLTEQFEMAKIAETEEGSQFEVIDHARPPDRKSKPRRSMIVILAGLTAGMLGVFLAFFLEFLEKRRRDEAAKARRAATPS